LEANLEALDEFFIEDLIETLNEIVHVFNDEAIPYSLDVCEKLADAYQDIMAQLGQSEDDMENSKLGNTANGCISGIFRLIASIGSQSKENGKEIISHIEEKVHDVLYNSLDKRFSDVHESIMTCIGVISFNSDTISSNLWQFFPKIIELVNHYLNPNTTDYGYISPGVMVMMNYMQKDPTTFVGVQMENGQTPFEAVVGIISNIIDLSHVRSDLILHKTGTELVIGLLENLHGKIDDSILNIVELMVNEFGEDTDVSTKKLIIQAVCM